MDPGMTDERTTVLIADDQRVVREGLTMVLGLMPGVEIVGSARDGEEAIALAEELRPDVVLMDLRMAPPRKSSFSPPTPTITASSRRCARAPAAS
jgi:DNA-binding NarL/FixJ family response regulator